MKSKDKLCLPILRRDFTKQQRYIRDDEETETFKLEIERQCYGIEGMMKRVSYLL